MTSTNSTRRRMMMIALLASGWPKLAPAQAARAEIEVWKAPSCGCCKDWITYIEATGFRVKVNDTGNSAARARLGMPAKFGSCHTAQINGYVIEGHVPAREIERLLRERPKAIGLSVPNMPLGSPGMDGPQYDKRRDPYDVLLIQADGSSKVFASYNRSGAK